MIKRTSPVAFLLGHRVFRRPMASNGLEEKNRPAVAETTQHLQYPVFKGIGTPSTTLLIQSPPSVPVFFRKKSLLSLYFPDNSYRGGFADLVMSELKYFNMLSTLFSGRIPAVYQKVISTVPINLLINSGNLNHFKTFHSLSLDGTADWAVFPKDAIQAFAGPNLVIKNKFIPKRVSRKLSKTLNLKRTTRTGLGGNGLIYNFVSGRGNVGLIGNGEIYQVTLEPNETVLVSKKNLLAVQVNGADDLQNLIYFQNLISQRTVEKDVPEQPLVQVEVVGQNPADKYLAVIKNALKKVYQSTKIATANVSRWLFNVVSSNNNYVNIVGPTKVLIQAGSKDIKFSSLNNLANRLSQDSNNTVNVAQGPLPVKNEDILSYVTIKNGKAQFENTPDFHASIGNAQQK